MARCSLDKFARPVHVNPNSDWRVAFAALGKERKVYQSQSGQVLSTEWEFEEGDERPNNAWIQRKEHDLMDQFDDISMHQKEFLKLWNEFVNKNPIHGNMYVQDACTKFAYLHRAVLRKKYRHSFVMHLVNLFNESLIFPTTFQLCVAYIDGEATRDDMDDDASSSHSDE